LERNFFSQNLAFLSRLSLTPLPRFLAARFQLVCFRYRNGIVWQQAFLFDWHWHAQALPEITSFDFK
jgi:hypothetical protein